MYCLAAIKRMNKQAARTSRGTQPYIAKCDGDKGVYGMPNWGDRRLRQWYLVHEHFVDSSGFGSPGEPAMTADSFIRRVKQGRGYAITSQGQFQIYIGEFVKVTAKQRRALAAIEALEGCLPPEALNFLLKE